MSKASDSPFGKKYLVSVFVSIATVFIATLLLPFPISFVVSIIVILSLSVIRVDIAMKRAGMGGIRGWYRYVTSSKPAHYDAYLLDPIKFSCMNCGKEHNKTACPQCGSKSVRAGR